MFVGISAILLTFLSIIVIVLRMTRQDEGESEPNDYSLINNQSRTDAYMSDKKGIRGFYFLVVIGVLVFIFFFTIPLSQAILMRIIGQPIYGTVERFRRSSFHWSANFETRMYVSYTIDNVHFMAVLNELQWNTTINSRIRLFVHPNDPTRVTTARLPGAYYLYIAFSLLFIIPSLLGIKYTKERIAIYEDMMRLGYVEDEMLYNIQNDDMDEDNRH